MKIPAPSDKILKTFPRHHAVFFFWKGHRAPNSVSSKNHGDSESIKGMLCHQDRHDAHGIQMMMGAVGPKLVPDSINTLLAVQTPYSID